MSGTMRFRRLVLELGHGPADPATMREAAAFARLLDAELHALFVEDETLLHASALPFAREISPLSFRWRKLAPDRLETELKAAADQAQRYLVQAARASGVRQTFEVRRGDLALNVFEICVASDVVVVASSGREPTHGSDQLRETAYRSAASVLFLPPDTARRRGLIVVIVTGAEDPSLAIAQRIAARGRERLLVLASSGVEVDGDVRVLPGRTAQDVMAAIGDARERLIVMTRDGSGAGAELAAARGVPVLLVEPA